MLSIPYMAPNGDTLLMRFRRLQGEGPKYLYMAGDKPRPFNTAAIEIPSDFICITEGEFDAMILHQIGLPAIAIPGVAGWKSDWRHIFTPYRTVFVFMDGDAPGRKFGDFLANELANARLIDLGDDLDVNDFYIQHGERQLLGKIGL